MEIIDTMVKNYEVLLLISKYVSAAFLMAIGVAATAIAQGKLSVCTIKSISENKEAEKALRGIHWPSMIILEMSSIWCLFLALLIIFK